MSGRKKAAGIVCVFMLALLAFCFCDNGEKEERMPAMGKGEPMVIWIASDLHFLSPDLSDGGEMFTRTVEGGDGKMVGDSEEIVDAFFAEVLEQKPDALIMSGDLTFNGEQESLEALADKLDRLQTAGIPVLVIPGNHDIEYPYAGRYIGDRVEAADQISETDFKDICGEFGYAAAVRKDRYSFSYLYLLAEDLGVLLLDSNTVKSPGEVSDETLKWMEEQLSWAREKGMEIISVSHQNVLPQNDLLSAGFVMDNCGEVFGLLEKYGVKTHFSGHSHIWHSRTQNGLTDAAIGSLTVAPLGYGVVEIDGTRRVSYHQENLTILQDESRKFFDMLTERQVRASLSELSLGEEVKREMVEFAVELNREYFAGTLENAGQLKRSGAWELWKENGRETFWYYYLDSILSE